MTLKNDVRTHLQEAGLSPMHRFGQNFMIDKSAVDCLINTAQIQAGDRILEIGPGTGIVTERLLQSGAAVLAVEIDNGMAQLIQRRFAESSLQLCHGDALENKNTFHPEILAFTDSQPWSLVANLPYDVSIPIILNALGLDNPPQHIVVTVQKETAVRLCARAGSKEWGASAVMAQAAGSGSIVRKLPPQCFYPAPKVDSAILHWRSERAVPKGFGLWCRGLFAYRRKVLRRGLRDTGMSREQAVDMCNQLHLDDNARVENLSVAQLLQLYDCISIQSS